MDASWRQPSARGTSRARTTFSGDCPRYRAGMARGRRPQTYEQVAFHGGSCGQNTVSADRIGWSVRRYSLGSTWSRQEGPAKPLTEPSQELEPSAARPHFARQGPLSILRRADRHEQSLDTHRQGTSTAAAPRPVPATDEEALERLDETGELDLTSRSCPTDGKSHSRPAPSSAGAAVSVRVATLRRG